MFTMSTEDLNNLRRKKLAELAEKLYDRVEDLSDDELNELYEQTMPERDAREWIRSSAIKAASSYRLRKEKVPPHVQATLDSTKQSSIQDVRPSELMQLVDTVLKPKTSSKRRAAFSFRQQSDQELSDKDQQILEDLAEEIEKKAQEDDT